ncbi:MAG TPA: hypothetical protein VGU45_10130 [Microvirga sp.]|jgi:hypothetical protein|nr:hypothetical protein [Microvirga sp.]
MKTFALLSLLLLAAPAAAQEAGAEAPAMTLSVRPSGYDADAESREREERLKKRMERADYLLRNICIQCGGGINRPGAYGPVDPVATLGRGR